ncbi:MAG: hypothetical protein VX741_11735, partial [Pseudomonadota bacterium]|nr:hypothetical protein [Pseudomonadota bacterium]
MDFPSRADVLAGHDCRRLAGHWDGIFCIRPGGKVAAGHADCKPSGGACDKTTSFHGTFLLQEPACSLNTKHLRSNKLRELKYRAAIFCFAGRTPLCLQQYRIRIGHGKLGQMPNILNS